MLTGIEPRALAGGYFALTAYTIWGLAPIYFRAVGEVPPFEIIAHRVVWSVVLLLAVLAGGFLGSRLGAVRFNPLTIQKILGLVVILALLLLSRNIWFS